MIATESVCGISSTLAHIDGHEKGAIVNIPTNIVCRHFDNSNMIAIKEPYIYVYQEGMNCNSDIAIGPQQLAFGSVKEGYHLFQKRNVALEQYTAKDTISCNALSMEDFMSSDQLLPVDMYISIIQVCRMRKDRKLVSKVHGKICSMGIESMPNFVNYLVPMFADCGFIFSAQQVSNKLHSMNEYSWTSLINGYVQSGQVLEAFIAFEQMQGALIDLTSYTFVILLNFCAELMDIEKGWKIHAEAVKEEFEGDLFVGNALIDMYGKCGSLSEAKEVFDKMLEHDVISWNTLIAGYVDNGCSQEAFACFEKLEGEGFLPDATTLSSLLKACSIEDAAAKGQRIHTYIMYKGFSADLLLETALIDMYAKAGLLLEAQYVFDKLQCRDIVSWTSLIAGYADHRLGEEAVQCFKRMLADSILPNVVSFACALKACGNDNSLINQGQVLHMEVVSKGLDGHVLAGNSLVAMYAKLGFLDEAEDLFDKVWPRDVVSWNSLISGYAEHGPYQQALFCFDEMQVEGVLPNSISYASVLKGCGSFGAISKGQKLHMDIVSKGLEERQAVGNSLISMYSNFSLLSEAHSVFKKLAGQDIVTWTAIMKGYAMNHDGKLAVDCFEDLLEQGAKADPVTMTCLLTACSHSGMVSEGYEYMKEMRDAFGITPNEGHYSCIIDMFGRSGRLYEAEKVLEMLCPPSDGTWAALLSACKTYGDIELGLRCFRELLKFDSDNPTWYIIMKDLYASAGRLNDAIMIENMRKQIGLIKKRASVTMEVDSKVHKFVVGGRQSEDLSRKLRSLSLQLKDEGHLANVDSVLKPASDKERETKICEHSERLAIAFGLLHTPEGQTLRLTKNLRMCDDCHTAGKMISQIEKREIILRDDSCVHHFIDGLCLCKDMF
ncbi:hypothetical protein GOP47_0010891 [Adiantum capillus-veneris]|uniref:DYW domain-containing protein n=1 Tax=Adiantum capillus-veneris TaxID=13818 RepID=A0A9D4UW59_ADICA|nr:hypothetical protein GOP47_0010891 [Adiantum capillus-veneris]